MTHKILSQEMHRHDTGNDQVIKTRVPREEIDDRGTIIVPHLRRSRLSTGDHIRVMCIDGADALLAKADFVIVSATTSMNRIEADNQNEMIVEQTNYRLARCTEWWTPPGAGVDVAAASPQVAASPAPAKAAKAA